MNQPNSPTSNSPPVLLIAGLVLGGALLAFMAWDSIAPSLQREKSASPHVVKLTEANWQKEVVESDIPVVVDFTAEWCGPCKILAPTINTLADRYQGKVKVGKFDVGDRSFHKATRLAALYRLGEGIPRILIFNKGEKLHRSYVGVQSESELVKGIDSVLAAN